MSYSMSQSTSGRMSQSSRRLALSPLELLAQPKAVRGAKIDVPTTSGTVAMAVPKGANSDTRLRLKGKGVATGKASKRGDQYVTLKIVLPDQPDDEFGEFLARWETENPYNPRTGMEG